MTNKLADGRFVRSSDGRPGYELAAEHDDTFKIITEEGWANESSGDVEAPSGYFWLVECPDGSIDNQWQSLLENVQSELEKYGQTFITPDAGWYVCCRDNDGIFFVYQFRTEAGARAYYADLDQMYAQWDEN